MNAGRAIAWAGANIAPLVLVPLGLVLIWVAIWLIWLPPTANGGAVARSVTTVDASAATRPTHKVTTVVKTSRGASPSRRSEALALALVFLGAGAAVVGVFHNRIGSLELDKDGVKIELTPEESSGAAELVGRLASGGAGAGAYARGLERYLRAVAERRPAWAEAPQAPAAVSAVHPGLTADQAASLANRIADELA